MAFINDTHKTATIAIANLATGGVIGTAPLTVDIASSFEIAQTTASQALSLAPPTDTTAGDRVTVGNTGTASFTIAGSVIDPGEFADFFWSGTAWQSQDGGRNQGVEVLVAAVPAGAFTVTHNLGLPATKFSWYVWRARNATGQDVTFRRNPAGDTANMAAFNATVALTNITFDFIPGA